jgi:hypothetical protein
MDTEAHDGSSHISRSARQPEDSPMDKKAKQPKKPKTATAKAKGTSKTT